MQICNLIYNLVALKLKFPSHHLEGLVHRLLSPASRVFGCRSGCVNIKSLQSCPTLWFIDCSLPGSSVHGILQARVLGWIAMPSSRGSAWPRDPTQSPVFPTLIGVFLTHWATWEVHFLLWLLSKWNMRQLDSRADVFYLTLKGYFLKNHGYNMWKVISWIVYQVDFIH